MKIKPKEVFLNLPIVLTFESEQELPAFASAVNTVLHGKVRLKYDDLGKLGEKIIGLFYLQRNDEYHSLREEFRQMIELEEMNNSNESKNS